MSNEFVRAIVENIVNDKFDTLKEDLSKAVSAKAVNVLESKKVMVGKKFFEKEEVNEEIDEDFNIGEKVRATNPKATPRYEITDKDDTHYHLKNPDGKTMKLPKERIHRVNKSKNENT